MAFFGLAVKELPSSVSSTHYTNEELKILYRLFSLGNKLKKPEYIVDVAEIAYEYDNYAQFSSSFENEQLIRYGLGPVFYQAFEYKKNHKNTK